MAQRNSSSRGTTATRTKRQPGNQTANTPGISESAISRMKVDDIRGQLRRRGVSGLSAMRKPDLVKTLVRKLRSEQGGAARKSTGPAGRPSATKKTAAAKKTTAARRTAPSRAKAAPSAKATGARAKAAPAKKAAGARAKAAPAKKAAAARAAPAKKTTTARAKAAPAKKTTTARAKAAPAKKTTTARAKAAPAKKATTARAKAAPAKKTTTARAKAAPARGTAAAATQVRSGRSASRSVSSSQQIMSLDDRPERPGRSLVTTNHEVIQRWARARGAKPATIAGTERGDRPGVLTFNIPGYRESSRIREVSWDDWFRTFDLRGLNLIYQEQMRDGRQSNFFRTENPNREDA
ncbi:hypothetical protein GCE86_23010 [Micromonospora terminaliae]|uniref:Rho termination factor N-terminal domain-containing protein n=2 Tax=Micromonospora terminaliae TaxID=1914461 RepID=A0AAJ2ZLV8_9ACTN|nr:hypothetical protein [Micromonospora terminaliae]QGL49641.1 hypothetical protein GCE86_23010 [Micromonospora terminaliae]